jgi:molybdopterin synthase catalytic subunit
MWSMNDVTVLFFATLKERAGVKQAVMALPEGACVRDLKARLAADFPGLKDSLASMLVAVNREFAFDDDPLPMGAEIAVFPPVSGGSEQAFPTFCMVTEDELDLDDLTARVTLPTTGAACLFTGMVRGVTKRNDAKELIQPHETTYLEYEAYRPMAEAKMLQVADEIRARWPAVEGIAIVQRIGRLEPGTPTVLIACSAAHRDTGVFEAARYGIDRLKEIVPVWKKEVGPQGETWVEGEYFPGKDG